MFNNLRVELVKKGLNNGNVGEIINETSEEVSSRLEGKTEFTLAEMLAIRNNLFPGMTLQYLFA